MTTFKWICGAVAGVGSMALLTLGAAAQTTTAPVAPKAATATPAAPPSTAAKAVAAAKAAVTPCRGRDEASCKADATACGWIVPTKPNAAGTVAQPFCRSVAGIAKKAADAKAAAAGALAKAGAAAKSAVTPAPAAPAATGAPKAAAPKQ